MYVGQAVLTYDQRLSNAARAAGLEVIAPTSSGAVTPSVGGC
ncbi:hypothetical protein [Tessaracoccus sp. G1721]